MSDQSSASLSELHQAARELAASGFAVFPIVPNGKEPATANGFKDGTTDLAQIDAWWTENPQYNIAWQPATSDMTVLDADPPLGEQTIAQIVAEEGTASLPPTYTVQTPRDGRHYYFMGDNPSSVQKLGPKLDTRSRGGYVLVPPSIVNGKPYVVLDDRDPAETPAWIARRLGQSVQQRATATAELDQPANLERARAALAARVAAADVAIEGAGGDDRTFRQACELMDLGVSEETTLDLMLNNWNSSCVPPWDPDELAAKVHNAAGYMQNEPGAYAVEPVADAFATYLSKQPKPKHPRFYAFAEGEQDAWQEPTWLVDDLLPDESTVMLFGPSRSYKSFLALDLALGLSYGVETFGTKRDPVETLYIAGEAPRGMARGRRPAWKIARGVEGNGQFYIMRDMPTMMNGGMDGMVEQIKKQGRSPKFIVIDTIAKAMAGMNENDARDAGLLIAGAERLRDEFKATVLLIHHTGKDLDRGARGSSAFFNGFDAVLEAKANNDTMTVEVNVRKQKDADEREQPWTFKGKLVGPGLVFFPMEGKEYNALNRKDDPFDGRKIGAALQKLRAVGSEHGVTSNVLASELLPVNPEQSAEDRTDALVKLGRKLSKLAHDKLSSYATGMGHDLRWFLPTKENP